MRIVLLCATNRGLVFLKKLVELLPQADLVVFSFREEPSEPPFLDNICSQTLTHGGVFHEARHIGSDMWQSFWTQKPVDLLLAVSWRFMIPPEVYRLAKYGAFVFHDSLLPAYRGFSPTVWAMINGENSTGVTLFEMAEDVDSGDIVDQEAVTIEPNETIESVMARVTATYLRILERQLFHLLDGTAPRIPQDHSLATFTCRRLQIDNKIDWSLSTDRIFNLIRAVTMPYSGAYTTFKGQELTVWSAERIASPDFVGRVPGRVVEVKLGRGVVVLTGDGSLLIKVVQVRDSGLVCASAVINCISCTLGI